MRGKGTAAEDFVNVTLGNVFDPNKNSLAHQFTHPDSGLNQALKTTENALGSVFDPNKNGLREKMDAAVEDFKRVTQQLPDDMKRALDPNQNGVADAFNKFGGDLKGAFTELGNKILAQAGADKAKLDEAFAPLVNEFSNPDSVLAKFIKQQVGTEEDWKRKFEDPDTYFLIASILLTAAAAVVTAPIGGVGAPAAFAAMQTALACTKMITHAAQGKPFDPMDAVAIVLAAGGPAIGKVTAYAGGQAGVAAEKAAEKLGIWNRLYGAVTPAAPAAGQWIAQGMQSAAFGFGTAAATNQIAYNMRPAEAVGQNFTAISTANLETSGPSPVAAPLESDTVKAARLRAMNIQPSAMPPQPQVSREEGQRLAAESQRDHELQLEKKARGEAYYSYEKGEFMPAVSAPVVPQGTTTQVNYDDTFDPRTGLYFPAVHDELSGSGLIDHVQKHLRGRKVHRNVDLSYFG